MAGFPLPVITGIGHSTNETVVEMVAHTNRITPTAVAGFLIQQFSDFEGEVNSLHNRMMTEAKQLLVSSALHLSRCSQRFRSSTGRLLGKHRSTLESNQERIRIFSRHYLALHNNQMAVYEKKTELLDPKNILQRGYSITYLDDRPLKAASLVSKGQRIITQLYEGSINSIVD